MYQTLFSPVKIGNIEIKNRCVMPPMLTNYGNEDGTVSDRLINYHVSRAKGGVGLIILEATVVEQESKSNSRGLVLDCDEKIPSFQKLVDQVHEAGAKIGIQIGHFGRQLNYAISKTSAIAPSARPCPVMQCPTREMTTQEVKEMVIKFANAVERAKKAGFDLVELHAAHGYLITQFLSPLTNHRTDEYGGTLENRERFLMEVLTASRERVGVDYPLTCRISIAEHVPGGLTEDMMITTCKHLVEQGIDAIHVSGGGYVGGHMISGPEDKNGYYADSAQRVKEAISSKVPVIVANRIREPKQAEEILASGKADMIATGRPLICDPEYYKKVMDGTEDRIRRCVSCCFCIDRVWSGGDIECIHNPLVGREGAFAVSMPAKVAKKLVVVGGGPAGMEAAYVAAKRGHQVTLFEEKSYLGGNVIPADKPPFKEMINVSDYLSEMVKQFKVDIRLNKKADVHDIMAEKPDAVFLATGAKAIIPNVPGITGDNVVSAEDILMGTVLPGKNVIVIGGGSVGIETAEFLYEKGCGVTVIEMKEDVLLDVTPTPRGVRMNYIQNKIALRTSEKVLEITESGVVTDQAVYKDADMIVLAVGYRANRSMETDIKMSGIPVTVIGDAQRARKIYDAVMEGFEAAYYL